MIVWKLATRPATAISASRRLPMPAPKIAWNPRNSGSSERPSAAAPGCHARVQEQRQEGAHDQREQAEQDAPRHVAGGVVRLLGRERQLLDRQVEPDGEGQRAEHARPAEGQPARSAGRRLDVEREVEREVRQRPDPEHDQDRQRRQRDAHREAEGGLDPGDVEPHEDAVGQAATRAAPSSRACRRSRPGSRRCRPRSRPASGCTPCSRPGRSRRRPRAPWPSARTSRRRRCGGARGSSRRC